MTFESKKNYFLGFFLEMDVLNTLLAMTSTECGILGFFKVQRIS
jgi:hypothetical protein